MRRDMKSGSAADACAEKHNRPLACAGAQWVERGQRRWSDAIEPSGSGAPTEPGIIHPPSFDRAFVPSFGFGRDPAVGAIGIAVETQNVNVRAVILLGQP